MKIFVVGYMGSGKTQTGYFLAKKLGYRFVDLDIVIEEAAGMKVKEIFANYGEDYFRELESEMIRSLAKNNENIVIATGGGAPCFYGNMDFMNEMGITIYLKLPPEQLADRLKHNKDKRPLISSLDDDGLYNFIRNHLKEREVKYYSKSKIIADMSKISLEQLYSILSYTIWIEKT